MKRLLLIICTVTLGVVLPGSVHAATLGLSPSSGSFTTGSTFGVSVRVNTQGVAINSAEATVRYPRNILEVSSISKGGLFTLWPSEPTYSNTDGQVTFAGGLPSPGYNGSAGTLITITFRSKSAGSATVNITGGRVLANDGSGTNVLTSQGSGTYTIADAPAPPNVPAAPTITSSSHPDSSAWYTLRDIVAEWTRGSGVTGFSYALDDQAETIPDTVQDTTGTSAQFTGIGDGVWYLHVRGVNSAGWGATAHFRVQIDATGPLPFTIFGTLNDVADPSIRRQISFETTDAVSGMHHYELSIDGGAAIGIDVGATTPYILPELGIGTHTLLVRAVDVAGNTTTSEATLIIGEPTPITPTPDPSVPQSETPFADLLPQPLVNIIKTLTNPIVRLRDNPEVSQVTDVILEPANNVVVAVAAVGLATSATAIELTNIFYLFFRFGYFWLIPITFGKKRKQWGIVFDGTTGRPVKNAVVRIFSKEFSKLKESQLTDAQGRFGFLVDIGEYYITATHPGYLFPSRVVQTSTISQYQHIYLGETFHIRDRVEGALTMNIPIDPDTNLVSPSRIKWLKILNVLGLVLEKLNIPLLIGGTLLSWVTLIFYPKPFNYFVLILYVALIILRWRLSKRIKRSWGQVRDETTREAVELAVVRIYDMSNGHVVATRITNREGKFTSLVQPGKYYLVVTHPTYEPFQTAPISVKKKHAVITTSVKLKRRIPVESTIAPMEPPIRPDQPSTPPIIPSSPSTPVSPDTSSRPGEPTK